ncbi:MAG TPA: hypothetical protein VGL20_15365 [Candidatus Dormibacteraeota bacterium]
MRTWRHLLAPLAGGLLLAACGDPAVVDQATTRPPLAAPGVVVTQTGDPDIGIPPGGVSFRLDAARLLVVDVRLRSSAATPRLVVVRASLFDSGGRLLGDASGSAVDVPPGADTTVQLTGPTPTGTIAAVTLEVHTVAAPSATASPGP